jgi:hypothetical protein
MPPFLVRMFSIAALLVMIPSAQATVLRSSISAVPESANDLFQWGDGVHNLAQAWSSAERNSKGWFYGTRHSSFSNADVYNAGVIDPTTVTHAALFPYSINPVLATEGETVFFRGANGYFGAWRIDNIYKLNDTQTSPVANLDGEWFFQDNGSSSFLVPEPASIALFASASLILARNQGRKRSKISLANPRNAVEMDP